MTDDEAITLATLLGARPWKYHWTPTDIWYVRQQVPHAPVHPAEVEQNRLTGGQRVFWYSEAEAARAVIAYHLAKEKQNDSEHAV